jgi:fructose-1,6-bisphosphatase/sedoheptulose 1,7-bisphosphatase-like protein
MGISDLNKKYREYEMAKGEVIFACAGVTDGYLLKGIRKNFKNSIFVESLILDSSKKKIIKTQSEILL